MKKLYIILIQFIPEFISSADYYPLSLPDLIMQADLIVMGEITEIDEVAFTLQIKDKIFGTYDQQTVRLRKFVDFRCVARWENMPQVKTFWYS